MAESDATVDHRLFDAYLKRAAGRYILLERLALHTRSLRMRELLAYAATGGTHTFAELGNFVRDKDSAMSGPGPIDRPMALALAGAVLQYEVEPGDKELAAALFNFVASRHPISEFGRRHQYRYVGALLDANERAGARKIMAASELSQDQQFELALDVGNPFTGDGDVDIWLGTFNQVFRDADLAPLTLASSDAAPFDRVRCATPHTASNGPLITVVTTTYRPDSTLLSSVRSILAQTWQNLEIIVVDDASGPGYDDVLEECAALDDRIRLIRQETNGGTYLARNTAFDASRGEFVTGQDSDDWSHPQRLERQVAPLLDDSSLIATRARAFNVTPDLEFRNYRASTLGVYYPSLMFRAFPVKERIGYFDAVRKSADGELKRRIVTVFNRPVLMIEEPLANRRVNRGTLSFDEIGPDWVAPRRAAYWSGYRQWHRELRKGSGGSPYVASGSRGPFDAPASFQINQNEAPTRTYDVVFLMDWVRLYAAQRSALNEALALVKAGYRVGVAHLESAHDMRSKIHLPAAPVQAAINRGVIDNVLLEDAVDVDVVVVRDPDVLEFPPADRPRWRTGRALIHADHPPFVVDGLDNRFGLAHSTTCVRELFGVEPEWVPASSIVRRHLEQRADAATIAPKVAGSDIRPVIETRDWVLPPPSRSMQPVIGRRAGESTASWPSSVAESRAIYPALDTEVRIVGDETVALAAMQMERLPANWVCFKPYQVSMRSFLQQLHFYVHFPDARHEDLSIIEAMAARRVVILPPEFEPAFGNAALYASPSNVASTVAEYFVNKDRYDEQCRIAAEFVQGEFSAERFIASFDRLLALASSG